MKKNSLILTFVLMNMSLFSQYSPNIFKYKTQNNNEIILLSEGQRDGRLDILIGATPEMLNSVLNGGTYPSATNAFLIRTEMGKNVLIDAGMGKELFNNLLDLNITTDMIDAVLITHLHSDHIGGLLDGSGLKTLPNASLYVSKPEFDYWTSPEASVKGQSRDLANAVLTAYQDKLILFEPGQEVLIGVIESLPVWGHTPGHTAYLVDNMFIWGDMVHAMAVQMPYPMVGVTYDMNSQQAINARLKMLKYIVDNNFSVAGMHLPYPGMFTIVANGQNSYTFTPLQSSLAPIDQE